MYLPSVPNGAVLANQKDFQPPILICPDRQAICLSNLDCRHPQTLPFAPKGRYINLPGIPQGAIVTQRESFKPVVEIECCIEPNNSNCIRWLWFRVPALTSPRTAGKNRHLLPPVTKRAVARRECFKVAICIFLDYGVGKIAVLGWFGRLGRETELVPRRAETLPIAPSDIWRHLPCVPKRGVSSHKK